MKTIKTLALALFVLVGATTAANAATAFLATDDFVGISFWLISMGMLAATAFFFMEQANVGYGDNGYHQAFRWRTCKLLGCWGWS